VWQFFPVLTVFVKVKVPGLVQSASRVMCDSAGVMYWADAGYAKIETVYLNGTGRRTLLTEPTSLYLAFAFHGDHIYIADGHNMYVCLMSVTS